MTRSRLTLMALVAITALVVVGLLQMAGGSPAKRDATRAVAAPAASEDLPPLKRRPQVVEALRPGEEAPPEAITGSGKPAAPPSDDEVREELALFRKELRSGGVKTGARAKILPNGEAVAPADAPAVVKQVIAAANAIALTPYKWGGGHGAWEDSGYDCSGSVSYVLHAAGVLDRPMASGAFMSYGKPGPGRYITIYANSGHMFMTINGRRFDTGYGGNGNRWAAGSRPTAGYVVRHPPGL